MKKVFALLIAILYLAVSSGLAVEIHHCMGEIIDFSLATSPGHKCPSCGMDKGSNKCCKDEMKFVKLQDSYKLLTVNYKLSVPEAELPHYYLVDNRLLNNTVIIKGSDHSPPGELNTSLYILHCVYRI